MPETVDGDSSSRRFLRSDLGIALALAISIVICLAAFIWIFVEIEPYMRDFTGNDVVITPGPDDPFATPVDSVDQPD
jgi:hypothetical protein